MNRVTPVVFLVALFWAAAVAPAGAAGLRDLRKAYEAGEFEIKVLQFDNKIPDFNVKLQIIPNAHSPSRAQKFIIQPGTLLLPTSEAQGDEFDKSMIVLKPVVVPWTPDGWAARYEEIPIYYVNFNMQGPQRGARLKVVRAPFEYIDMIEYKRGGSIAELQTAIWLAGDKDRPYEEYATHYGDTNYGVTREVYEDLRNYARRALISAEKQRMHEAQRKAIEAARALETPEERKLREARDAFEEKDRNQDGAITLVEFVGEVRKGLLSSKALMARRKGRPFKKIDVDGDGIISRKEWLEFYEVDHLL